MARKSLLDAQPIILRCAFLSCAIIHERFRAMDILFFIELYSNQLHLGTFGRDLTIQPTQINRIVEALQKDGDAYIEKDGYKKLFRVPPKGVLRLIRDLVLQEVYLPVVETVFAQYFVTTYADHVRRYIESDTSIGQDSLDQLDHLLSPRTIITRQLQLLETAIKSTERKIESTEAMVEYFASEVDRKPLESVIAEMPSSFSYELSYRKPLRELFSELPEAYRAYEIRHGFAQRNESLYKRLLPALLAEKQQLENFLRES
jgi:hypothetical protein